MEEDKKVNQDELDMVEPAEAASETGVAADVIPEPDPEPLRESAAPTTTPGSRLERKGKRGKEARSMAARDVALMNLVESVENDRTRDYIENRIMPQMNWYSRKSNEYKTLYQNFMTASIVLGALIPVFSVALNEGPLGIRIFIALLGTSVTAINAYLSLHNYRDLWITYRTTGENLLRTMYYYFNGVGVFSKGTQEDRDARLIEGLERELASENGTWRSVVENQSNAMISQQTGSE